MSVKRFRSIYVFLLVLAAIISIIWGVRNAEKQPATLPFNDVAMAANEGTIERIVVEGNELRITFDNGDEAVSTKDPASSAAEQLAAMGVSAEELTAIEWQVREPDNMETWLTALTYVLPLFFVAGVVFILLRQAQKSIDDRGTT